MPVYRYSRKHSYWLGWGSAWFAIGANKSHGRQRTAIDKRHAVTKALQEFPCRTQAEIARQVGCAQQVCSQVQAELTTGCKLELPPTRIGSDGKERTTAYASRKQPSASTTPEAVDRIGYPIPEQVLELWNHCAEIQAQLTTLSKLKTMVERAQETDDVAFAEVNFSSLIGHLSNAYAMLAVVKGYAVCTTCQGLNPKTCRLCRGRGFVSKFLWNGPAISRQTKEMRFKEARQ